MKPYRGIIRIECRKPKTARCPLDFKRDCKAGCVNCEHAAAAVINLSGEEICRLETQRPEGRNPKAGAARGAKQ